MQKHTTPKRAIVLSLLGLSLALGSFWFAAEYGRRPGSGKYAAPGIDALSAQAAVVDAGTLAAALLLGVYEGFGKSRENEIYDTLARVAHGTALEALYLERAGALARGGLTGSDQTVHEMRIKDMQARRAGETLNLDAQWEVIGTVGHDEHQHVRGNAYRAKLSVSPVDGAWKIVDFELLDVDRTSAGELHEPDSG